MTGIYSYGLPAIYIYTHQPIIYYYYIDKVYNNSIESNSKMDNFENEGFMREPVIIPYKSVIL